MNAITTWARDEAAPSVDLPVFTRLLPSLLSLLMLLPATLLLEYRREMGMLVPLLWLQSLVLAMGAASLAVAAHGRLGPWEGRVAPGVARRRVRHLLLRDLARMGAIGLAGPLVLAAVLDWQASELRVLVGVAALLSASLCGGLLLSLAWQGRAPRVLVLPALLVVGALTVPDVIESLSHGDPLQSLAIVACAGLLWSWLLSRRALAVCAPPWPRPSLMAWWRRSWAHRVWLRVPSRVGATEHKRIGASPLALFIWTPQLMMQSAHMDLLSWGQAYSEAKPIMGYGLWLLAIGILGSTSLVAPPLQWRHRLAPGALTAQRWARRLVLGSMLTFVAILSCGFGLASLVNKLPFWPVDASAWLSAIGDMLLVISFLVWQRGRRNTWKDGLLIVLAVSLISVALLAGLTWLGLTPQRGPVWLLIQLALVVPLLLAAIRAWAQQDLNAMA